MRASTGIAAATLTLACGGSGATAPAVQQGLLPPPPQQIVRIVAVPNDYIGSGGLDSEAKVDHVVRDSIIANCTQRVRAFGIDWARNRGLELRADKPLTDAQGLQMLLGKAGLGGNYEILYRYRQPTASLSLLFYSFAGVSTEPDLTMSEQDSFLKLADDVLKCKQ